MLDKFPVLQKVVEIIGKKNLFQKKALKKYFRESDVAFLKKAENYLRGYLSFLNANGIALEYVAESYLMMVKDIMLEQTMFCRTGRYRYDNLKEVNEKVYSNSEYMHRYMIGVALSQFLWRNHRDMFTFFSKHVGIKGGTRYLEIGPGHGLFFKEAVTINIFSEFHAIDISETSIGITKRFICHEEEVNNAAIKFFLGDVTAYKFRNKYNFITMGEVLEHVEDPVALLKMVRDLLVNQGRAYISTCANAPVIDHIYLYNSIDEIRDDIKGVGLVILDEIAICNDDLPVEDWASKKANVSYACIVQNQ